MNARPLTVLVDAMCAQFGGIRTFVDGLLTTWHDEYPDDVLHVLVGEGADLDTREHVRHEVPVARPSVVGRPLAQSRWMPRLVREIGADAVVATAPTTTVRRPGAPMAIVVLDLRHEILPDQFSRGRRLLRDVSYGRSYQICDAVVGISQRTVDDVHRLHPGTRARPSSVAYLGADHVAAWPRGNSGGTAVAFGHHTNKNPDLVVDAWAELRDRGTVPCNLTVLGVASDLREELQARIDRHGLGEQVRLARFLPDEEYLRVITDASMIVFPSDFEGFGLPIVEGMALGIPVVIGPEPGSLEVAGSHAVVIEDWTPAALADAVQRAADRDAADVEAARTWAAGFTWAGTVRSIRASLVKAAEGRP